MNLSFFIYIANTLSEKNILYGGLVATLSKSFLLQLIVVTNVISQCFLIFSIVFPKQHYYSTLKNSI